MSKSKRIPGVDSNTPQKSEIIEPLGCSYAAVSATGSAVASECLFHGFIVTESTSGTLIIKDGAAGTALFDKAVTKGDVVTFPKPIQMSNGVHATIGGTSATIAVLYE